MKNCLSVLVVLCSFFAAAQNPSVDKLRRTVDMRKDLGRRLGEIEIAGPSKFVNTFIGTGGHGHTFPGATAPFGMMQLSPDTRHDGWDGCGGYHYDDSLVYGFSHTHLSGTGVPDYADLLICPQVGIPQTEPKFIDPAGYGHKFSHKNERSSPGFYSVNLHESNIKVALTTTTRSGMHRYDFGPTAQSKYVLLDLDYRDKVKSAGFNILSSNSLQGHRISQAWAEEQHFYFFLETNVPWTSVKEVTKDGRHKLLIKFPEESTTILIRVGMSAVDENGAKQNLQSEITHWNFDAIRKLTQKKWDSELSKISFHSKDLNLKTIFYTALYHSYISPNIFSDIDGRYRGMDKQIHQLDYPEDAQYTVFSLWDTFRAAHPLFTLTQQKRTSDFLETFKRQYQQGKDLPVWELAGNETECMIGYHSVSVIADAAIKGLPISEPQVFLQAMIETANRNEFGKLDFQNKGFISLNKEPESVSKALEFAYDDFCISSFAKKIGKNEIAQKYYQSSLNFINHYDPTTGFFRARRSGLWFAPFQPAEVNFNYTEANAWQYSAFAPHAIGVLNTLHSTSGGLQRHLETLFTASSETSGREQADITGLIGQYAHGNEPSHHMAYLFNYLDSPDKTQYYVDKILKEQYQNTPNGLSGNEDCGQMSAWYVLSALGFYQVAPGNPYYDFGRPIADSASIQFENGKTVFFKMVNQSPENMYIQNIKWDGQKYDKRFVSFEDLQKGGKWEITMGPLTSSAFKLTKKAPTIEAIPADFLPVPHFTNEQRIFDDKIFVEIVSPLKNGNHQIQYKTSPDGLWVDYSSKIELNTSTQFFARVFNRSTNTYSSEVDAFFTKKQNNVLLDLKTQFANQYSAGGPEALIDGIEGENEYRTGDWQGFFGEDLEFILAPKEPKNQFLLEIGVIEDLKSWIFYPKAMKIELSTDGINYIAIEENWDEKIIDYRPSQRKTISKNMEATLPIVKIKVTLQNAGKCPNWHLGSGNPTWLFVDEVKLK